MNGTTMEGLVATMPGIGRLLGGKGTAMKTGYGTDLQKLGV